MTLKAISVRSVTASAIVVVAAATFLAIPAVAAPAGVHMPFPCNETWYASTYGGHSPSEYSVDWNLLGDDSGRSVLAGVAGTATVMPYHSGYGNWVEVDAGGGWTFRYAHLSSISVGNGPVGPLTEIGKVGNTGNSTGSHLHYEQRLDGDVRPATFGGVAVTYAYSWPGNPYTSANCGGAVTGTPTAVARGAGAMNVFYRTSDNKLVGRGWDASTGWNQVELATNVSGNPVAIMRGDKMEVFYRNTNDGLSNVGWDATSGWHAAAQVGIIANGIQSDPAAISFNSDNIEIFVRTINNELKSYSWHPSVGWYGLNTRISSGVDSSPSAVIRDANNVDIFYRRTNGNLGKLSWNLSGPWTTYEWAADMAAAAVPAVVSRTSGNLDVFYRKNINYIMNRNWDWTVGWNLNEWVGLLAGNPAVVARTTGDMDVVYRESGSPGTIKNLRWNWQTGWVSGFIASDAQGDPVIIKRSVNNMDVFYRDVNNNLKIITWSSGTGWSAPVEPN